MAFINDRVLDYGLIKLSSEADRLNICSALPGTYVQAATTSGYACGYHLNSTVAAPSDSTTTGLGRKVVVPAITTGLVNKTTTATHWAISATTAALLLAAGPLTTPQVVTSGNTFSLGEFYIKFPDAT